MRPVLAVGICLLCVAATAAQQPTFRSGIDLVRVDALVTRDRAPVSGLTAADFELRDNGVLQNIDRVMYESVPLAVTFAVDASQSMAGLKFRSLQDAVNAALDSLRPDDRSALLAFSHEVQVRATFGDSVPAVRSAMSSVTPTGGTALFDAAYAALASSDTQDARALVLMFSDGIDNASWLTSEEVRRAAQRSNAVVYTVVASRANVWPDGIVTYTRAETDFLDGLASTTGGRLLHVDAIKDLLQTFDSILREFRTRYLITYYPRGVAAGGWHAIDLKLKHHRGEVKARRGYQR